MGMFKRAFLYVTRKRGKTFILFAILLIMATFVLTGLSVQEASETAQSSLRQSLGGTFDIFVDWKNSPYVVQENVTEENDEETGKSSVSFLQYSTVQLTPENISAIKEIPGVKYCSASLSDLVPFEELSLFPGTVPIAEKYQKRTKLMGVCSTEDNELFTSGTLTLTEGQHITGSDQSVAIISKDLAERSGLGIGDFLTTHAYHVKEQNYSGQKMQVKIIGLFTPNTVEPFGEMVTFYDKIQNRVFVDLRTASSIDGGEINYGFSAVHITIDDPREMTRVVSDVKKISEIDWKAFVVEMDNEIYEKAAAPLTALHDLVVTLLFLIIFVSAIILTLILTLWTKSRIHEIGVFLSVGMKKTAIIGQYLMEVLLIAIFAFGFSYFTSNAVAEQIGSHLLAQVQTEAEKKEESEVSVSSASVAVGEDTLLPTSPPAKMGIEASVGVLNFVQLFLIGLTIIVIAVSASSITIMRLKPREILSQMS